jgi:hypothetical protein
MDNLIGLLNTHQDSNTTRLDQLAEHIRDLQKETQDRFKHIVGLLQLSNAAHGAACRTLKGQLETIQKAIGTGYDKDGGKSLMERLDNVFFAAEDLLEQAKDQEANGVCASVFILAT